MANFKFVRHQATIAEIESLGYTVEGRLACCQATGQWHDTEKFIVITGEPCSGQVFYVDDNLSGTEEVIADAAAKPGAVGAH